MKKRILKVLLLGFLGLVGAWLAACGWLVIFGPNWIVNRIKTNYSHEIQIEKISTNLFNAVYFHNVSFEGPHPGKIGKAEVALGWRGPRVRVKALDLDLNLQKSGSPEKLALPNIPFVPVPIDIVESRLNVHSDKGEFSFEDVTATLRDYKTSINTAVSGHLKNWGPIEAKASVKRTNPLVWSGTIHAPSLNVAQFQTLVSTAFPGDISGRADVRATFNNAAWTLEASGKGLKWRAPDSEAAVPISFMCSLSPQTLTLQSLKIDRAIQVSGDIVAPFSTAELKLKATAEQWSLAHLKNVLPATKNLLIDGEATFDLNISGPKTAPAVEGTFSLQPKIGALMLPPTTGQVSMKDNKTTILADFAKGKMSLQQASSESTEKYFLILQDVSLNDVAEKNGWKNVRGRLNSRLSANIVNEIPKLQGTFSIDGLQWGRTKKQTTTEGELALSPSGISLTTADGTLVIKAEQDANETRLSNFHIDFGGGATMSARGVLNKKNQKLNFALDGRNIPPDIWPPLVSRYPEIAGDMDFSGTVGGTIDEPSFNMGTVFKTIQFIPAGSEWNGTATAEWDTSGFLLRDIAVEGGYQGIVSVKKRGEKNIVSAEMTLTDSDPKFLFDLFKSTLITQGRVSGEAKFQHDGTGMVGTSSAVWTSGKIGNFQFEKIDSLVRFDKSLITIEDISLVHNFGTLRGAGTVSFQSPYAKYNLTLQLQQVGPEKVKLDGEVNTTGVFSMKDRKGQGRFVSPLLVINDFSVENVKVRYENYDNFLQINGTGGDSVAFDIKANHRRQSVKGQLSAFDIDLNKSLGKIFTGVSEKIFPEGPCNLSASIEGPWADPVLHAKLTLSKGRWRDEPLSSSMVFDINRSSITLKGAEVKLDKGGTVFLTGTLPFDKEKSVAITGAGTSLGLQSVMNLLDWPLKWKGKTDATFSMIGAGTSRKIVITFDGHHDGFGPIEEGGKLNGTAAWQNGAWDLSEVRAETADGYVRLREGSVVFIDRNKAGKMRLVADTRNVRMGVLTLFGRLELTGSWDPPKAPQENGEKGERPVELEIFARSLWINQYVLDGNVTHLTIEKNRLKFSPIIGSDQQLSGSLEYENYPDMVMHNLKLVDDGVEQFYLDGLVGPSKWDFKLNSRKIDASIIRGLFDTTLPLSGPMEVKLVGQGTFQDPRISASVIWRDGKIGPLPLDHATCALRLQNGILSIEKLEVQRKKGYVLNGTIRLGTALLGEDVVVPPQIDLRLTKGNMALLETIVPGLNKAKGSFEGELQMKTTDGISTLQGFLTANGISFNSSSYFPQLRKGEIDIRLRNDLLEISKARAQIGKGVFNSSGTITFRDGIPEHYSVRLFTGERGISIRVPDLAIPPGPVLGRFSVLKSKLAGVSRGDPRFDLSLVGPAVGPTLTGTVWLENTVFTYPPQETRRPGETNFVKTWLRDLYRNLNWNVTMVARRRVQFENELVSAAVSGQLKFVGPTQNMDIRGSITSDQGVIIYAGKEFKIREATVEIIPEAEVVGSNENLGTYVYLRANAEQEIFYTDISGNSLSDVIFMDIDRALIGEIQPRFRSKNNPGLPSNRALQLALGIPLTESLEENLPVTITRQTQERADVDQMLRLGVIQLIDSNLASPLARALARQTGLIDTIRLTYAQPETSTAETTNQTNAATSGSPTNQNAWWRQFKGTKVKFGRELSSRLFADYSFKVDEYQNEVDFRHEVELAYRVHRNLFIRATSELDSEESLGRQPDRRALIENRWRFGLPRRKKTPQPQP